MMRFQNKVEIDCETDLEYEIMEFNWRLRSFDKLREIGLNKGLPPDGDVITSPMFVDARGGCWWLRVYPYQLKPGFTGAVSIFLHTLRGGAEADRAAAAEEQLHTNDLYFSLILMALDEKGQRIEETVCGTRLQKLPASHHPAKKKPLSTKKSTDGAVARGPTSSSTGEDSRTASTTANYGFYDFIQNEEVLERILVRDEDAAGTQSSGSAHNVLHIYCKVIIYSSLVTKLRNVREDPPPPIQKLSLNNAA